MLIDLLAAGAHAATGLGSPAEMWDAIVRDFSNITSPKAVATFLQGVFPGMTVQYIPSIDPFIDPV